METTITAEQLTAAETMPLEELRLLAIKEMSQPVVEPDKTDKKVRNDKGQFVGKSDVLDNSKETDNTAQEVHTNQIVQNDQNTDLVDIDDGQPTRTVFIRKIDNEDGSGVDVYEAGTQEELIDKLAAGKANANKKIRELNSRVKTQTAAEKQSDEDLEFIVSEKLKTKPRQTMKEIAVETLREQQEAIARCSAAEGTFLAANPEYNNVGSNRYKMHEWVRTHGYAEITPTNLQKAYQDLKQSGLLELKDAGANDATDVNDKTTQRTVEDLSNTTQQRSQSRGSTISTRTRTTSPRVEAPPTDDEAYTMPLEKLRELADKQLAQRREA